MDLGHPGLGPLTTARLVSGRAFAPDLYIPMARTQAPAKLGGQVNIVYVRAASAAAVGAVTGEISRLLPSARVTNSASLAGIVHHEDLWRLCRDELTGLDVRTGGWDIRGRWFGVVVGATPRTGELRRGETIPWRVIAAQLAPRGRRGPR